MTLNSLRKTLALGSAALTLSTALIGLSAPVEAGNGGMPCEQGDFMGTFVMKSLYNNKFVKASGNNKRLKAQKTQQPSAGSWGSFDVFVVGGNATDGFLYALRSSKDKRRWATIERNDNKLKFQAKQCTTTTSSKLFRVENAPGAYKFRSMKNNKYLGVKNNEKIVADYDSQNERTQLQAIRVTP